MSTRLPVKDPSESVVVVFDFSKETAAITGPTVTAAVQWSATEDLTPGALLQGSAQVNGSNSAQALQRVVAGVDLTDYALRCSATAANGDVLVVAAVLPVRSQPQ